MQRHSGEPKPSRCESIHEPVPIFAVAATTARMGFTPSLLYDVPLGSSRIPTFDKPNLRFDLQDML
jgi:hypothetical protein